MDPFAGERYFNLATFRKTGKEVATPVWFVEHDGRYLVFSEARAGKVKRLRNSPRAKVAACNVRGGVHGDWHDATATLIEHPERIRAAHQAMRGKYQLQMRIADLLARLSGRIHNRAWIEVVLDGP